jgi:hypothetical protein
MTQTFPILDLLAKAEALKEFFAGAFEFGEIEELLKQYRPGPY